MSKFLFTLAVVAAFSSPLLPQEKKPPIIETNVTYGKGADVELKLDLARPATGEGPFPVVVCVHGGAWQLGHRGMHASTIRLLAENGYAAATISYRLAPKYLWPAQIEDAKCAVRFLRSKAKEWNLDPDRIASLGDSAGGHLALLLGLMNPEDGCEGTGGNGQCSSRVQAVVNFFGPTDFPTFVVPPEGEAIFKFGMKKSSHDILADFLGTSERGAEILKKASPVRYATPGDPAVLTFHGGNDFIVPVQQAKVLHETLKRSAIPERLEILEGVNHGWGGLLREKTNRITLEFLKEQFKKD